MTEYGANDNNENEFNALPALNESMNDFPDPFEEPTISPSRPEINRGNTQPYPNNYSSECVFPPRPINIDNDPGDKRVFRKGEPVCLNDEFFKKGTYVRSIVNRGEKYPIAHIINSNNFHRDVRYYKVGKLVLKENVIKAHYAKNKNIPSNIVGKIQSYGGTRKQKQKPRKTRKTARSSRKLKRAL